MDGSGITTLERWFRWLDEHGGVNPMAAVAATLTAAQTGRAADAERWADAVDRWQYGSPERASDPTAEAWAAVVSRTQTITRARELGLLEG